MQISIHDVITGEITVRDLTADEIAELEAKALAKVKAHKAKVEAKSALLERLGITEEEAQLLLG
jgi:hypothetical protein